MPACSGRKCPSSFEEGGRFVSIPAPPTSPRPLLIRSPRLACSCLACSCLACSCLACSCLACSCLAYPRRTCPVAAACHSYPSSSTPLPPSVAPTLPRLPRCRHLSLLPSPRLPRCRLSLLPSPRLLRCRRLSLLPSPRLPRCGCRLPLLPSLCLLRCRRLRIPRHRTDRPLSRLV